MGGERVHHPCGFAQIQVAALRHARAHLACRIPVGPTCAATVSGRRRQFVWSPVSSNSISRGCGGLAVRPLLTAACGRKQTNRCRRRCGHAPRLRRGGFGSWVGCLTGRALLPCRPGNLARSRAEAFAYHAAHSRRMRLRPFRICRSPNLPNGYGARRASARSLRTRL